MEEIDVKKTKYFVIAIIILIVLSIILIVHFDNKKMVSGSDDTTKTTTKSDIIPITTTSTKTTTKKATVNTVKKEEIKEENIVEVIDREETIYKSTIDENNQLIYNYKLTDEINNEDSIISTKLSISEVLKNKNIIGLFDISLFDDMLNKKSVSNSLINIKIPIKDELIGYDEYKVIYINENNEITNEEFNVKIENNYIEFETTHLSIFGIIGIKNIIEEIPEEIKPEEELNEEVKEEIDLSEVDILLNINDIDYISNKDNTLLLSKSDKFDIKVSNIDYEYQVYYSLTGENDGIDYELFNKSILEDINTNNLYNLKIKVVVMDKYVEFDMGNISVYDIVYINDGKEQKEPIGTIYNEDGTIYVPEDNDEYLYNDKDINKDIVIDNGDNIISSVTKEELDKEQDNEVLNNTTQTDNEVNIGEQTEKLTEETIDNNTNKDKEDKDSNTNETDVKVKINGNIYLVEETDISNLEMTGYLIIDTSENITFDNYDVFKNLYTITIRSKIFTLKNIKYTYEYNDNNIIIKKYIEPDLEPDDNIENESVVEIDIEDFKNIFDNDFNELVIEKNQNDEQIDAESNNLKENKEETTIENNLNDEQINKETITE